MKIYAFPTEDGRILITYGTEEGIKQIIEVARKDGVEIDNEWSIQDGLVSHESYILLIPQIVQG